MTTPDRLTTLAIALLAIGCEPVPALQPATPTPAAEPATPYGDPTGVNRGSTAQSHDGPSPASTTQATRQETGYQQDAPSCVTMTVMNTANRGYTHQVSVRNGCTDDVYCEVGTDHDPDAAVPLRVRATMHGHVIVTTRAKRAARRAVGFCDPVSDG